MMPWIFLPGVTGGRQAGFASCGRLLLGCALAAWAALAPHDGLCALTWPVSINTNAASDSQTDEQPALATGGGTWGVAWIAPGANSLDARGNFGDPARSYNNDLYFSRSLDGGQTWSPRVLIKTNSATDFYDDAQPSIATDGQGHWMVAWLSTDPLSGSLGFDADILMSYSGDNGLTWTPPAPVNTDASSDPGGMTTISDPCAYDHTPMVVSDGKGRWMVSWIRYDARSGSWVTSAMVAASVNNGSTWSAPKALQTMSTGEMYSQEPPTLATNRQGVWIATWCKRNNSSSDFDLYYAVSTDDGATWSAAAMLNTNGTSDSGNDIFPWVATDAQGRWVAVWVYTALGVGGRGADADIMFATSTNNGQTWSAPALLNADAVVEGAHSPQVIYDGAGNWFAGWMTKGLGGDYDFYYAACPVGSTAWSAPKPVNHWAPTDTSAAADASLCLAGLDSGRWGAVWSSAKALAAGNSGNDADLCFSIYDPALVDGAKLSLSSSQLLFTRASGLAVDVTKGGAPTQSTLTVKNTGNQMLTLSSLQLQGAHMSDYSLVNMPTLPLTLFPGASQALTIRFAPAESSYTLGLNASIDIQSNDRDLSVISVPLLGDAVPVTLSGFAAE